MGCLQEHTPPKESRNNSAFGIVGITCYIESIKRNLLLLDDVFSELDNDQNREASSSSVADQTFITTAIQPKIIQQNMYHEVKEGKAVS